MAFIYKSGQLKTSWFPKKVSTAMTVGVPSTWESGYLIDAVASSTRIAGVPLRSVASTDSDYANTGKVPVVLAMPNTVFEADVQGTLTVAMVGGKYDLYAGGKVDIGNTSYKQVTIVGFISTSKALVQINGGYQYGIL